MASVSIRNVKKNYGDVAVLREVSVDITDGEFVVLVGPSGCGKSTLLRMIAGLEDITGGEIAIDGKVVNRLPPKERDIAMVFQNYALYPHMTVAQNMAFSLTLAKAPAAEKNARVEAAAAILGLTDLLSRFPRQLSGGQRQRVAMGRAIVRNPKVFLFDEPLSNLDAKMRVEMRKEILDLHNRLTNTMIYVTHDQVEAMTLGDRICVMKGGVMQQIGTPSEVFDDPANLFVAGFIGTPPMNLMPGRIAAVDGGAEFHGEGFSAPIPKDMLKAIPGLTGRNVMLGLRSKALSLAGPSSRVIWRGMRTVTEMLGEEALVHLALGGSKVVMNVEPHALDGIGKEIGLEPQMNRAHFFDADSGENLTAGIELPGRRSVRR